MSLKSKSLLITYIVKEPASFKKSSTVLIVTISLVDVTAFQFLHLTSFNVRL